MKVPDHPEGVSTSMVKSAVQPTAWEGSGVGFERPLCGDIHIGPQQLLRSVQQLPKSRFSLIIAFNRGGETELAAITLKVASLKLSGTAG